MPANDPIDLVRRVRIVPLTLAHAPRMFAWMSDPEIRDNVGVRPEPSLAYTNSWIQNALADDSIDPSAVLLDDEHVGNVVLDHIDTARRSARFSIYIGERNAAGRGTGSTATYLALQQAFSRRALGSVWLTVHHRNQRAIAMYERLGFVCIETRPGAFAFRGERLDELVMEIRADDFARLAVRWT